MRHLLPRRACAPARRWLAARATQPRPPNTARLFERGRKWIDANLFNGEYYIQKVRGYPRGSIAASLRSSMGSEDTEKPEYQVGEGCLVDQLIGQYLADVAGLGPLLDPRNIRKALESIYRYNYQPTWSRTSALSASTPSTTKAPWSSATTPSPSAR